MATWVHQDVLDFGIDRIKQTATKMLLIKAYTLGDSYATVTNASNIIAQVTPDLGPSDFTIASSGNNRTLTVASGKNDPSANNSCLVTDDIHVAFTNGTDKVLWVTDATNQAVTAGNSVTLGQVVYTANQPTQV